MVDNTHHQDIQTIIEAHKAEKSVIQQWRNYAVKALGEAQAFVKMGKTTAYDNH